jgi:hypothetical protein
MASISITGEITEKNLFALPDLSADDVVKITLIAKVDSIVKPADENASNTLDSDGNSVEKLVLVNDGSAVEVEAQTVERRDNRNLFVKLRAY